MFYTARGSSFISTKFLVLNLDGQFGVANVLIFDIPLLYYHIILQSVS